MSGKDFFILVKAMREAQKEYFATRTTSALQKSKELERGVDAEIQRVADIMNQQQCNADCFEHTKNNIL